MRAAPPVLALALGLAACAPVETEPAEPGHLPARTELTDLDRLTVDRLRRAGDDPLAVRPVEHVLLPAGATDPTGLAAAMGTAGFGVPDVQVRPGFETKVVVLSDARDPTLGRQVGWLEANAPAFGYRHATWTTEPVTSRPEALPAIE